MEMVTTFCGQEHLPLKWGIFPQNPLKCVGSKTLEISLTATSHGFESHPLRQRKPHKPSVYAVFPYLYCKKESSVYIGEQIRNSHRDLFPNFNLCFELAKNERAPKKQIAQRQNFLISCRNVIASLKNKVFMI